MGDHPQSTAGGGAGGLGMIWAQDRAGLLGADGGLLWRVPEDFRHFKASTMGCGLVMGRTTWESLGGPLAGRRNVVLSRDASWRAEGAVSARSLRAGLAAAARGLGAELGPDRRTAPAAGLPRIWVIGGGTVYREALADGLADLLLVSTIDIDAAARAARRGDVLNDPVAAPRIEPDEWALDRGLSDPEGSWRPVSGDARWRLDAYRHL